MGTLRDDLGGPGIEEIETGLARVFVGPGDVVKIKKAVSVGGYDAYTPEKRRGACLAEIRRNAPLAPGVYRGVVPVTFDTRGAHRLGGSGEAVDWALVMRRLPERDRADVRLAEGRLADADLARVARRLARFHDESRCDEETVHAGSLDAVAAGLREDFAAARETLRRYLSEAEAEELEAAQQRSVEEQSDRWKGRVEAGRIVDGHGDLRLEHLYLDDGGGIAILDRIELDRHHRYADACADVAVLAEDLALHGRVDLAERFVAAYADAANDFELYPFVDFYASRHAFARGLVQAILAADSGAPEAARERAAALARRCFRLALAERRRGLLPPVLLAVGGLVASGKSTLARAIAAEMGAPVVLADHTKSFLVKGGTRRAADAHEASWARAFEPGFRGVVYGEMLERADAVLSSGRGVVVDGCFASAELRAAALRLAQERGVRFLFAECRADEALVRERLLERARADGHGPDGWLGIAEELRRLYEPVSGLPEEQLVVLDSARRLEDNVRRLARRLPTWPAALTG